MLPANGDSTSSSNGQGKGEKSQVEEREETQKCQPIETPKTSLPSQLK